MLAENIVKLAQINWAAQIVIVPEKDEFLRFSVQYRKLNAVTERDLYLIPRLHEFIDSLEEAPVFSSLYADSCFWLAEKTFGEHPGRTHLHCLKQKLFKPRMHLKTL